MFLYFYPDPLPHKGKSAVSSFQAAALSANIDFTLLVRLLLELHETRVPTYKLLVLLMFA